MMNAKVKNRAGLNPFLQMPIAVGMIITFRAIVASGTSDPRLMATGIGQAMIATVLGLGIAIPLLFINAGLAAMSRGLTQTLDEQSQAMLAANAKRGG